MTTVQNDSHRQAGELRTGGFLGWNPGVRMRLAMKAGASSAAGFAAMWGLRFITQLLIANKIGSGAFGELGLVMLVITGLNLLADIGITPNIVQSKRGDDPEFLDTAYSMNVVRGASLWLIAAVIAFPAARFFGYPGMAGMLVIAASSLAIRGISSSALWTLTRHVQVHKLTILNLVSEVAGFLVALVWVYRDPSAWALIAGTVAASVVYTIGSYLLGRRPQFRWDPSAASELISFGSWLFLSTATYFAASQAERLALGKSISPEELGCFTAAVTMASAPTRAIGQLFEQVFFPLIARLRREDPPRSLLQFRRVKLIATVLGVGASAVCILGGPYAVDLLLTDEYHAAGWMLQLLGFRAACEILSGPTVSMLFASGQSKFAATGNIMRLAVMAPGLWITLHFYGLREAVWVLVLAPFAAYVVALHAVYRHVRGIFRVEWLTMLVLLAASVAFAVVYRYLM